MNDSEFAPEFTGENPERELREARFAKWALIGTPVVCALVGIGVLCAGVNSDNTFEIIAGAFDLVVTPISAIAIARHCRPYFDAMKDAQTIVNFEKQFKSDE